MLKLLLRDFKNKIFSKVLIISVVAISVMLFYCVFCYHQTIMDLYSMEYTVIPGDTDVMISANSVRGSNFVDATKLASYDEVDGVVGEMNVGGLYKKTNNETTVLDFRAFDKKNITKLHKINFVSKVFDTPENILEDQIIISQKFAKSNGLKLYDSLIVKLNSKETVFYVGGIAKDDGYFFDNSNTVLAVDSRVSSIVGWPIGGLYNRVFVNLNEGEDAASFVNFLSNSNEYGAMTVELSLDIDAVEKDANLYTTVFLGVSVLIVSLAMIIVYRLLDMQYSEKALQTSRLKALGATDKQLVGLYLAEALIYCLLGGVIGAAFSAIAFKLIILLSLGFSISGFSFLNAVLSILLMSAVTVAVSLKPVFKIIKVGVRQNTAESKSSVYMPRYALFAISTAVFLTLLIADGFINTRGKLSLATLISFIVFIVFLAPVFLRGVGKMCGISKILPLKLIGKTLDRDKNLLSVAQIMFIGICTVVVLFQTVSLTTSVGDEIKKYCVDKAVVLNTSGLTNEDLSVFDGIDGIDAVYPIVEGDGVIKTENDEVISKLCGIDGNAIGKVYILECVTPQSVLSERLSDTSKNNIILSENARKIYGVSEGDTVKVSYKNKLIDFVVCGFIYTAYQNGDIAFLNRYVMAEAFGLEAYDKIIVEAKDEAKAVSDIIEGFAEERGEYILSLTLTDYWMNIRAETYKIEAFYKNLSYYICIAIVIAMAFNLVFGLKARQREFFKYRGIGLSKNGLISLQSSEMLVLSLSCAVVAVLISMLFVYVVYKVVWITGFYPKYDFDLLRAAIIALPFVLTANLLPLVASFSNLKAPDVSSYKNN